MTPEIEQKLRAAAVQAKAVDADVVALDIFQSIVAKVASEADAALAVTEMRKLRPSLFRETDYSKMSSKDFDAAEASFLANLRKPRTFGPTPFHDLDASRLTSEELHALDHCVGGESNSWDRGLLTKALARQRAEDSALGGDAA